ncbi:ABC transporter ATP-binding protein [Paracoccus alkanivorans]|uniref:Spermidine/putrescine import ATP-binding protein PotA n=1 Tax=Paracoccus alkanivorans TaxID=2116655 RepID=A0A3M0MLV3_9RHOB|nr:ABC transporter ATP-binding protein [Paracoccus alkanivorans]RMC37274.1 ABC transporter ATP-binding protein [Paracoccus alkanivorans]
MAFLELQGLTKLYNHFVAVSNFDLKVDKGSFVSLLGPSGCGKTTTLQMIAGFTEPSSGSIFLNGKDLSNIPARKRGLGIVFQSYALFMHMTVAENVAFGLEMRKIDRSERDRRVADTLELVHLAHLADRYPVAMSGGQRQRVALARALVIEPELLLLDEPLSNLDAKLREEMQLELRRIQQEAGVTTVMVTHDQSEAMALSDSVVVMENGKIRQEATPFDVYETPTSPFVSNFLGKSNNMRAELISQTPDGAIVECNGIRLESDPVSLPQGPVVVAIRPERIEIASSATDIPGRVTERVFLGSQWLLKVETGLGELLVTRRNTGHREAAPGDQVFLNWDRRHLRILPVEQKVSRT